MFATGDAIIAHLGYDAWTGHVVGNLLVLVLIGFLAFVVGCVYLMRAVGGTRVHYSIQKL
jgi:hypothetical protein